MHLGWVFRPYFIYPASPTLWHEKAMKIALTLRDLGIITGNEDGTFRPEQPITRMEAANLIYRTLAYLGKFSPI